MAFKKPDVTLRSNQLKIDRKKPMQTLLKDDLALLDESTEHIIIENLTSRYSKDKIYTYIGEVCVSVNPYKTMDLYNKNYVNQYKGREIYEEFQKLWQEHCNLN